jgi:hypothetical protein
VRRNCAADLRAVDFPNPRPYCGLSEWRDGQDQYEYWPQHQLRRPQTGNLARTKASTSPVDACSLHCGGTILLLSTGDFAQAQSLRQGISAFNRQDYMRASQVFIPLAERGEASAQTYLGFMFETGRGVPQNYTEAAMWYRRAAEQGDSLAQYSLGLLYDHGQGVPRDIVEANKWLNLSTAGAPRRAREARARIRDAVTTKMTRGEIARARLRALEWAPVREH